MVILAWPKSCCIPVFKAKMTSGFKNRLRTRPQDSSKRTSSCCDNIRSMRLATRRYRKPCSWFVRTSFHSVAFLTICFKTVSSRLTIAGLTFWGAHSFESLGILGTDITNSLIGKERFKGLNYISLDVVASFVHRNQIQIFVCKCLKCWNARPRYELEFALCYLSFASS